MLAPDREGQGSRGAAFPLSFSTYRFHFSLTGAEHTGCLALLKWGVELLSVLHSPSPLVPHLSCFIYLLPLFFSLTHLSSLPLGRSEWEQVSYYLTGTISDSLSMSGPEKSLKGTCPGEGGLSHILQRGPSTGYLSRSSLDKGNVLYSSNYCAPTAPVCWKAMPDFVEIPLPFHRGPLEQNFPKFSSRTFASIPKVERKIQ